MLPPTPSRPTDRQQPRKHAYTPRGTDLRPATFNLEYLLRISFRNGQCLYKPRDPGETGGD